MNIEEYQKVKQMTYLHYCDYLQDKYGVGRADYMTKTSTRIQKYRERVKSYMPITKWKTNIPGCLKEQ